MRITLPAIECLLQRGGASTAWSHACMVFLVLEGGVHTWKKEVTFDLWHPSAAAEFCGLCRMGDMTSNPVTGPTLEGTGWLGMLGAQVSPVSAQAVDTCHVMCSLTRDEFLFFSGLALPPS